MEIAEFKEKARATWAAGDYAASGAVELWPVGERIVRRLAVRPGEDVLDVACGTGNAAIRAAQAGARVVALDLTPELFAPGRRAAREAGVAVDWVEGDAEALPFGGESFDVVVSTFGCMFAPRHDVAARELARVLRPGGRLGVCAWTPEGAMGRFVMRLGRDGPPLPGFASPPPLWGSPDHVRALFAGTGVEVEFARETLASQREFDSPEAAVEFFTTTFGPLIGVRAAAEADGTWSELRGELTAFFGDDEPAEYLVTLGRRVGQA
jgi:SAM-dependent methyltransferase